MNEDMLNVFLNRHSVRSYTGEKIPMEKLKMIIVAGFSSASGSAIRPWELIVVRDKQKLIDMSGCRLRGSSRMLAGADAAIIVDRDGQYASDGFRDRCRKLLDSGTAERSNRRRIDRRLSAPTAPVSVRVPARSNPFPGNS